MNGRVRAVIRKEFREYRRNKLIVFTMAGLPVVFLAIFVGATVALPDTVSDEVVDAVVGQIHMFFLLIPDHVTQQHLEILSEIAEMFSDESIRQALSTETDPAAVHARITQWQPSLHALG